ncbi:MAG: hypothetical protein CFK52_06475 [Chloracidobacterium sp. CP2_5A]|nr:MAG: hypothetical protein CFK52_06475 [Chloracidobacterium sp. CP2_5A]
MTNQPLPRAKTSAKASLVRLALWRAPALVAAGFCLLSAPGLAQDAAPYQRTRTNDDFRAPRAAPLSQAPLSDTPALSQSDASPSPAGAPEPAAPSADAPDGAPLSELIARQDANGNWVLVSRALPPPKKSPMPAAPLAPIASGKPELDAVIMEMATKHGVDPRLIVEVIRQESGFNPYAISPAGAKGLMQLIDGTAARMGTRNVFDVRQNIEGGVKYLRMLLDMFNGDVSLALAGYNAGEHRVIRNGYQVPNIAETRHYVKAILARYGKSFHRAAPNPSPKPLSAPPAEPTPEPLRVVVRDGVILLTNR